MKSSHVPRENITKVLPILTVVVAILIGLLSLWYFAPPKPANAQATPPPTQQTATSNPSPDRQLSPEELRQREEWHTAMAQTPLPKSGCFQATYPSKEWRESQCTPAPKFPMMPPKRGPRPFIVGNGDDISAQAPSGFISTGIGSFDSVSVTSEAGQINGTGPQVANAYSLQLNTNFFVSTACAGSPNPGCQGWEQFVFANDGTQGFAFIQYWLIQFNAPCPAATPAWIPFSFPGSTDIFCFKNSANSSLTPNEPITNLINLRLSGTVGAGGDSYTFSDGTTVFAATGDNAVNAAAGWNIAEFNIIGNAGSGQANFNAGASITPRTRIFSGSRLPPPCVAVGFTGETNNLSFGPTAPAASAPGPAVIFTESTAGGATANCMAAVSVGDTHLHTFNGLFYDFQASGDFVLAQTDNFAVQTRQVSGRPTWPDASVNNAVATKMGNSKVAICLSPAPRVNVNGTDTEVRDGTPVSTPDGVDIWRTGNTYIITDQSGNSVRAVVNSTYIDVSVGLGRWPTTVAGLLANAKDNVNALAARDGTVLTNPFSFQELYQRYGESWRVPAGESLLSVCGGEVERGNPSRPFYARDLDRQVYDRTRAVCIAAGVKGEAFLDACTLDVAVIGNDDAAKVFVKLHQPIAVGNVVGGGDGGGRWKLLLWLLLLLLLIVIVVIVWLRVRRKRTTA